MSTITKDAQIEEYEMQYLSEIFKENKRTFMSLSQYDPKANTMGIFTGKLDKLVFSQNISFSIISLETATNFDQLNYMRINMENRRILYMRPIFGQLNYLRINMGNRLILYTRPFFGQLESTCLNKTNQTMLYKSDLHNWSENRSRI